MLKNTTHKFIVFIALLIFSTNSKAQVALVNDAVGSSSTFNFSIAPGTNRFLYIIVTGEFSAANNVSSVMYGGKNMTLTGNTSVSTLGALNDVAIFYLKESDLSGLLNNTISINYTNGNSTLNSVGSSVFLFQNVNQLTPIDQVKGNTAINQIPIGSTSNINSTAIDAIVTAVNSSDLSSITVSSGFSLIHNMLLTQHSHAAALKFVSANGADNPIFTMAATTPRMAYSAIRIRGEIAPLSVTFLQLNVKNEEKNNLINWSTANELNNAGFTVERSSDGKNFEKVGTVNAKSEDGTVNNYLFTDVKPLLGTNYYRIVQHDFDGKTTYSKIKSVLVNDIRTNIFSIYPNPVIDLAFFNYETIDEEILSGNIMDATGKIVQQKEFNTSASNSNYNFDLSELSKGMYFVSLVSSKTGEKMVKPIIKN